MMCPFCQETDLLEDARFCFTCGGKLLDVRDNLYPLIELYFHRGYAYKAIVGLLDKFH